MTTHYLKTWPQFLQDVKARRKTFEFRRDDREPPFQVGDTLILMEYDPISDRFGDGECSVFVTYIVRGAPFPEGWCVMGIELGWENWSRLKSCSAGPISKGPAHE